MKLKEFCETSPILTTNSIIENLQYFIKLLNSSIVTLLLFPQRISIIFSLDTPAAFETISRFLVL